MNIAIIPARGGSKRIPRKNIRPFRGRPIIAWSIEAALASGVFNEVMVSTDDPEIAAIAREHGAQVPFLRTTTTANDTATTVAVLEEVLHTYAQQGRSFERGCCLYPTAPFTTAADLRHGLEQLHQGDVDMLLPITPFSFPIWRSLERRTDGTVRMFFPEHRQARSQDLPPAYHDAGQWYWFNVPALLAERTLYGERTGSIVVPPTHVQDIDHESDWVLAELKHGRLFPGP